MQLIVVKCSLYTWSESDRWLSKHYSRALQNRMGIILGYPAATGQQQRDYSDWAVRGKGIMESS